MSRSASWNRSKGPQFIYECTGAAKQYLLREGTDPKYGARHLKRRLGAGQLVYPLSNLIATEQVHLGDLVRVDFDPSGGCLTFSKEAEGLPDSCHGWPEQVRSAAAQPSCCLSRG